MSLMPTSTTTLATPGCASTSRWKRARADSPIPSRSSRPPEMPALTTAMPRGARRAARWSVQRSSRSRLAVAPSVMESPITTTVRAVAGASTSIPLRNSRAVVVAPSRSLRGGSGRPGRSRCSAAHPSGRSAAAWAGNVDVDLYGLKVAGGQRQRVAQALLAGRDDRSRLAVEGQRTGMAPALPATLAAPIRSGVVP
jgi:hypothetical protein